MLIGVGPEGPGFFEAFREGVIMRRADLHILGLRIIELMLNPALKRLIPVRASGQAKKGHGSKSDNSNSIPLRFHS